MFPRHLPSSTPSAAASPLTIGVMDVPPGYSRHDMRIARILALAELAGTPISVAYLDSCDVRALPVILERLEAARGRHARGRAIRDLLPLARDRALSGAGRGAR